MFISTSSLVHTTYSMQSLQSWHCLSLHTVSIHCSNHFNLDTVYLYIISSTNTLHTVCNHCIVLIISILTLFISISSLVHTHYIQYPINVLIISILTALFISISYLVQTHYRQYAIIVLIITILTLFISAYSMQS